MRASLALLVALGACLLSAAPARAIPAFARRYTASCNLCHGPAYPSLNMFGRRFKENGYQLDAPGEDPYRQQQNRRPDPAERLELLAEPPLSLRAQSSAMVTPDARDAGGNPSDLRPIEALYLLAGASVYPNVSLFVSAALGPRPAIHDAAVGFHNLLSPEGYANVRAGRLLLMDYVRPEHRFLTGSGNPIATTVVGLNPVVPDSTQHGVEVFGRLLWRRLFYRVALVQGAQGPDGVNDLDGFKDLFGELQATVHPRLNLGAFAFLGRTQITSETVALAVRFTDRFRTFGGQVELDTPAVNLFAQVLYADHDNPFGNGEHADYWGYRVEAQAPLGPRFFFIARYDQLGSHHLEEQQQFKRVTLHLGALLLTNLRLAVESLVPLQAIEGSTLSLRLDVAL
jgi:hypothetical protein